MTTEEQIIFQGQQAHELIYHTPYTELYEKVAMDLAKEWLSTAPNEYERRKELYNIYAGMREFGNRIVNLVAQKDSLLAEEPVNNEEDESN